MLLGVVFKQTGAAPLTEIPVKGPYSKRDFERSARFHGVEFNMPPVFPDRRRRRRRASCCGRKQQDPADGARLAKALYRAFFVEGRDISKPDDAAKVAGEHGFDARGRARRDRRSGDQGRAEARGRQARSPPACSARRSSSSTASRSGASTASTRSSAGSRRADSERRRTVAEYTLYGFAQSGNCYKVALALELAGADWAPRFVDYFGGETRTPAYRAINVMGEVPVLEHRGKRLSQSGVILDYLAETLGRFGAEGRRRAARDPALAPVRQSQAHELHRDLPVHARAREGSESRVLAEFRKRAETRVGHPRRASCGPPLRRRRPPDHRRPLDVRLPLLRRRDRRRLDRASRCRGWLPRIALPGLHEAPRAGCVDARCLND